MKQHATIAVAALLALALAIISPTSALAKTKTRTLKGKGSETFAVDLRTGAISGEISGRISHLGKVTGTVKGVGVPQPDGSFTGSGTITIRAANGDKLKGTFTVKGTSAGDEVTVKIKITGGTGRFADASGSLSVICNVTSTSHQGHRLVITGDCRVTGTLSH